MPPTTHILVVTGAKDPKLKVDYSVFDALQKFTGVGYTRLDEVTYSRFVEYTETLRIENGEMPDVHMSMHMGPDGARFADRVASPQELSIPLSGVNFLFLAGCQSTSIGEYLPVVPFILSLLEDVEHRHAWQLARLFWTAKCNGFDAKRSYQLALERLPGIAPFAHLHSSDFLALKAS